jgi:hypothetical protein
MSLGLLFASSRQQQRPHMDHHGGNNTRAIPLGLRDYRCYQVRSQKRHCGLRTTRQNLSYPTTGTTTMVVASAQHITLPATATSTDYFKGQLPRPTCHTYDRGFGQQRQRTTPLQGPIAQANVPYLRPRLRPATSKDYSTLRANCPGQRAIPTTEASASNVKGLLHFKGQLPRPTCHTYDRGFGQQRQRTSPFQGSGQQRYKDYDYIAPWLHTTYNSKDLTTRQYYRIFNH